MSDTIEVAGAPAARSSNILDHLDLVEQVIRQRGWHRHRQADDFRSAGYYKLAILSTSGRCDDVDDLRRFLSVCIRNAISKERRALGAKRHRLVQCGDDSPAIAALTSREIAPDRMAMLREDHDLDHLDFAPGGQPRKARRLTPADKEAIRRILDENPTWGVKKIARAFQAQTGSPVALNTIQKYRREFTGVASERDRCLARAMGQPRAVDRPGRSLKTA